MKYYIFNINCELFVRIVVRISVSCVNWIKICVNGVNGVYINFII